MEEIPLSKDKVAIVDKDDFFELIKYKWYFNKGYAARDLWLGDKKKKTLLMHRTLMKTPNGYDTDHINQNKLDNRKSNLRICTRSQNSVNKGLQKNNKSGYKGVHFFKQTKRWMATIYINKKRVHLGYFSKAEEAAKVYNKALKEHYGSFALLNKI